MAVKAKVGTGTLRKVAKPKTTSIGHGLHSRPQRKGKKKYRGQG
jgi:hypothetical protein